MGNGRDGFARLGGGASGLGVGRSASTSRDGGTAVGFTGKTRTRDTHASASVTALAATVPRNTSIKLDWVNPGDTDCTGVTIRSLLGATAPTLKTGTLVTDTAKTATSYADTTLTAGTQYSYAIFAHDGIPNYAAAANVTTATTTLTRPRAVLSVNNHHGLTAKASVGGYTPGFDLLASTAGSGETLVSALLDYGDGTTKSFTEDPATWASEHLFCDPRRVGLEVLDDGCGFDPSHARQGRLGMTGMRERASLIGAQFAVSSRPGATCVSLDLGPTSGPAAAA